MSPGWRSLAAFRLVGVEFSWLERAAREASKIAQRDAPGAHLSDLEHVVLLATSPRGFGRTGDVELFLLLGDVGQNWSQPLVLDDRGLVHLRALVESAVGQIGYVAT